MIGFQCCFEINREWLMETGNDLFNTSDHKFYVGRIFSDFSLITISLGELNNFSLTMFYGCLARLTESRIDQYACFVNIPVLLLAYFAIERIHISATGTLIRPIYTLGLLPLLAYVPLINKDAFGALFYSILALFLVQPGILRALLIVLLLPLRIQHLLVLVTGLTFQLPAIKPSLRIGILVTFYLVFSIAAGFVSSSNLLFNATDATGSAMGLGNLVRILNSFAYLGSILLNMIIPLKYIFDLGRSVQFSDSAVGATVMIGRVVTTALLALNIRRLIQLIYCPPLFYHRRQLYCLSSIVCSFFLTWMISPIVHYRYLLNIVPLLMAGLSIMTVGRQLVPEPPKTAASAGD